MLHKPRLLSDNGPSYVAGELKTGSKTGRCAMFAVLQSTRRHRVRSNDGIRHSKNRILLENYYLPGDLEKQVQTFVEHYESPALP